MRFSQHPEWQLYDQAQLIALDTDTGDADLLLSYQTPPDLCPPDQPSHIFKSAEIHGQLLTVVTQTEVLVIDLTRMTIAERYSERTFNDLHHAATIDGRLHVVSTGLDCLVVLPGNGNSMDFRTALGDDLWERFDPDTDYRLVPTTKPHASHPNYVFQTEQGIWLTRFQQRDAVCLDQPGLTIDIGVGMPHDGVVTDDGVWFTTVNGHVIRADPSTGAVVDDYDLNEIDGRGQPLGWCRGLALIDGITFVGFSRLRQTSVRRNIAWVRRGLRHIGANEAMPTRVAAFDLANRKLLGEWPLESVEQDAIFSILASYPVATQ